MTAATEERRSSDRDAGTLDDEADRKELKDRYYGLLQELRVLVPGAQVLAAFMLTAPFSSQFHELDQQGRVVFGFSMLAVLVAIVCFTGPIAFHRFGPRRGRSERLQWAIRCCRVGLVFLGASLTAACYVITSFMFGGAVGVIATAVLLGALVVVWLLLPIRLHAEMSHERAVPVDEGTRVGTTGRSPDRPGSLDTHAR